MKKLIGGILAILTLVILFPSCDNTESYADKVKKERKNIKNFIAQNNIDVIYEYPEGGKFKDNEFFYTSGIYMQVVDPGNENIKVRDPNEFYTVVNVRFKETRILPDTITYNNLDNGSYLPIEFKYGNVNTYLNSSKSNRDAYIFLSPALATPLKYVGDEGIVKLLIPFSQGSHYQQYENYGATYMGYVKYKIIL